MNMKAKDDVPYAVAKGNSNAIKALCFVVVISILINVGLGVLAAKQYARKEKTPEPIIFEVDKTAHKVVRVEKGNLGATKESLLRSVTLREHVFNRETINHLDEKDRWKKVRLMSDKKVWGDFQALVDPRINKESVLLNKKFKRKIQIITDFVVDANTNLHRVEFYSTDFIDGEEYPTQRYFALIRYKTENAFVSYEDRFINIGGFKVTRYELYGA